MEWDGTIRLGARFPLIGTISICLISGSHGVQAQDSPDAARTAPVTVSGGCGCRLGSADHGTNGGVLACGLALMALIFRRRRH